MRAAPRAKLTANDRSDRLLFLPERSPLPTMPPADDNALKALQDYYAEHQVLPSYTTIADLLGLKSKAWISALVSRLILQRFLAFTADSNSP